MAIGRSPSYATREGRILLNAGKNTSWRYLPSGRSCPPFLSFASGDSTNAELSDTGFLLSTDSQHETQTMLREFVNSINSLSRCHITTNSLH